MGPSHAEFGVDIGDLDQVGRDICSRLKLKRGVAGLGDENGSALNGYQFRYHTVRAVPVPRLVAPLDLCSKPYTTPPFEPNVNFTLPEAFSIGAATGRPAPVKNSTCTPEREW